VNKTLPSLALCTAAVLTACGGGGASIGGTISGLTSGATVTLQDNGSDTRTVSADGPFTFATELDADVAFDVTVLTQPAGESCTVAGGEGTVDASADPVSVAVSCVVSASVSGVVSGLAPGTAVTLSNGAQLLPVTANGAFAFPGVLAPGTAYAVTIATQPVGATCVITDGMGTVSGTTPIPVEVTCS